MKIRGNQVALPHGGLPEMISPYMQKLITETGGENGPIGRQFISQTQHEQFNQNETDDPLLEEQNEVAPGVIYKYRGKLKESGDVEYYGRILWTISRFCATYCRFCFRGRIVGIPANKSQTSGETIVQRPHLTDEDISKVIQFVKDHKEINEVILSGGDPLIAPKDYLEKIFSHLSELQKNGDIDFVRIHTRAPITNPHVIQRHHFELFNKIKNINIVLHINHSAEITPEVLEITEKLRQQGAQLFSQSVLLRGVNDDVKILSELFLKLAKNGIRPYYLHQNDTIPWAKHFTVPIHEAMKLWKQLRPRLSGIVGTVKFVIDTPGGYGKVAVPEWGWDFEDNHFYDFNEKKIEIK